MKRFLTDRVDRFGALGQAALDLLRAESVTLKDELRLNARRLAGVATMFVVALFALFWALGALIFSLVELGTIWLPRWGSALVMVGLLALVVLVLLAVARRRLERLETPVATLKRRAEDYQDWWERRMGSGLEAGSHRAPNRGGGPARTPENVVSRRPDA